MRRLLALTLLLAAAAHAETYKWVDERGVINYSNTPPLTAAKAAQTVADRVSTYETDPMLGRVANYSAPTPYEVMLQQEWLQRQRLMATSQLPVYAAPPAETYYRSGYYYPVATVVRPVRRTPHRR
ncbi:MAG: hypothetical protein QOD26_3750 [Betaproteobacteria bacterium]|jgi:hypothetical protein|nr:hypothetical protein [Betaproteobacteria bacterium]